MLNLKLKNSVLDKLTDNYIERAIFVLWKIDIINLIKVKASLVKNFYMPPSEIDKMSMWEYELFIKELSELNKEDNKNQEEEMKKYDINNYKKHMSPPKLPSLPKMKY